MNGKIHLNHFHGKEVDISYALSTFASQENCDGEEYDCMQRASEYIKYLESITAVKFSEAVLENKLDDWVRDIFGDINDDEIENMGYHIRHGVKQFLNMKK